MLNSKTIHLTITILLTFFVVILLVDGYLWLIKSRYEGTIHTISYSCPQYTYYIPPNISTLNVEPQNPYDVFEPVTPLCQGRTTVEYILNSNYSSPALETIRTPINITIYETKTNYFNKIKKWVGM